MKRHFFQRRLTYCQQVHEKILSITSHQGYGIKNHDEKSPTSHLLECQLSKRQK